MLLPVSRPGTSTPHLCKAHLPHLTDRLRYQAQSPEHLPLQTQAALGTLRGHPQDPMVWDNADGREGGGSGKASWRRWLLHGVEEEQNACLLELWLRSGPRPPRQVAPSPVGVGGAGTPVAHTCSHTFTDSCAFNTLRVGEGSSAKRVTRL